MPSWARRTRRRNRGNEMEGNLKNSLLGLLSEVKDRYGSDSEIYSLLTALSSIAPAIEMIRSNPLINTRDSTRDLALSEGAEPPPTNGWWC